MTFDRAAFTKLQKGKMAEARAARAGEMIHLRQAAIAAEHMMGTPEWDTFLSYLEAAKIEAKRLHSIYIAELADPRLVDANEVAKRRIAIFRLNERIATLTMVITMPSEIRKHGHVADERLKELAALEEEKAA